MILPHNTEIEEKFLASLIMVPKSVYKIIELEKEDFYKTINGEIFDCILYLKNKKSSIELPLIGEVLKTKKLFTAKTVKYLSYLSDISQVALNPYSYSKKIKDFSNARKLMLECMRIIDEGKKTNNPDKLIEYAQEQIMSVSPSGTRDKYHSAEALMVDTINRIEKSQTAMESLGIDIGLSGIKNRLHIEGSKLIIIAGRPGQGKTALMLAIAKHTSLQRIKTGIISIEMDKEELSDRMISQDSGINTLSFYSPGKLNEKELSSLGQSANLISTLPITINDSRANINDLIRRCRQMKKDGVKIIFIDQLSKISYDPKLSEYQGYTRNCNRIAELKKELRIPIVLLCQLGRKVEESANKRPMMTHLKQTGAIEEDADVVLFIYRPGCYGLKNNTGEKYSKAFTEIIIDKVRNGIPGSDYTTTFNYKLGCFDLKTF